MPISPPDHDAFERFGRIVFGTGARRDPAREPELRPWAAIVLAAVIVAVVLMLALGLLGGVEARSQEPATYPRPQIVPHGFS